MICSEDAPCRSESSRSKGFLPHCPADQKQRENAYYSRPVLRWPHLKAVKVTDADIFAKAPKTVSWGRYVYFSLEMEFMLKYYRQECAWETESYDGRKPEDGNFLFRRKGCRLPMAPSTFT